GTAHLGIFGSRRNLLLTKIEMFHDGNRNAVVVAPADDPDVMAEAKRSGKNVVSFGKSETADMRVSDVQWREGGAMAITLHSGGESDTVSLSVAHEAYPINICAAAAIAKAAGVPLAAIGASLQGFSG